MAQIKKEYIQFVAYEEFKHIDSNDSTAKVKTKGTNKKRYENKRKFDDNICSYIKSQKDCPYGENCRYSHKINQEKSEKLENLPGPCYNFQIKGKCIYGEMCRFSSDHIIDQINVCDEEKCKNYEGPSNTLNKDVQRELRKKSYNLSRADSLIKTFNRNDESEILLDDLSKNRGSIFIDNDDIQALKETKKKLDLTNKLYLAPLTTLGNLPFRRLCVEFGAEVTCSEMALAHSLLEGNQAEWALLKRHPSEKIFGIQICGSKREMLCKTVQVIEEQCELDFLDLNCGCPLDNICNKGSGCGLIRNKSHHNKLINIIKDVSTVLTRTPLTLKTRIGYNKNDMIIHETILPKLYEAGANYVSIHGRTRQQRYTKMADWDYIKNICIPAASPLPVIGNGDILSLEDYRAAIEPSNHGNKCCSVMLARGALIKPWLFYEIKNNQPWDISSNERLDILRKYVNYGLEHWGSDIRGVETTRRFLLEWQSFLHRYIPLGLLERPPQKINEKPPRYVGRDDLETLMASPLSSDWIKISEMLLGPVPDGFSFIPKHIANSYTVAE